MKVMRVLIYDGSESEIRRTLTANHTYVRGKKRFGDNLRIEEYFLVDALGRLDVAKAKAPRNMKSRKEVEL